MGCDKEPISRKNNDRRDVSVVIFHGEEAMDEKDRLLANYDWRSYDDLSCAVPIPNQQRNYRPPAPRFLDEREASALGVECGACGRRRCPYSPDRHFLRARTGISKNCALAPGINTRMAVLKKEAARDLLMCQA
jgi:hypothetical protein